MAKVSAFGFTNTTASTHDITPTVLGLTTNYAVDEETANQAVLNNKTAPTDIEELITYRSRKINQVNTGLNIQYPSPVKSGIQYQVSVEDTLSTTDTVDASFRVDEPIVCTLTVRHPRSGNITNSQVTSVMMRLISALTRSDGTWRFDDLMRMAEKPIAD